MLVAFRLVLALALTAWLAPALAQRPPQQLGPAVGQATAGIAAAQSALGDLLRDAEVARKAGADQNVRTALAALSTQAALLQGTIGKLLAAGNSGEATADPETVCRAANVKLLALAHDILHLYETESFQSLLVRSYEPILGLYRVQLENLVQDRDDQLREQSCVTEPKSATPSALR